VDHDGEPAQAAEQRELVPRKERVAGQYRGDPEPAGFAEFVQVGEEDQSQGDPGVLSEIHRQLSRPKRRRLRERESDSKREVI
jgi:hypothetical protein